tara:strand:+ start:49 stop:675 length:627 start_codon:yes stop_codon:yes gene_type:complete
MAIDKIQAESINLADTFAFTGTVTGTPSDMVKIATTTVSSNVSSVDFETLSTDYNNFIVHIGGVEPSSNDYTLSCRFKLGGSYRDGSGDYSNSRQRIYQTGGSTWTDSANGFTGTGGVCSLGINSSGNGYNETGTNAQVLFYNVHSTTKGKSFLANSWGGTNNQNSHSQLCGVTYTGTSRLTALQGIRFYFSAGSVAKGTFTLFGVKA